MNESVYPKEVEIPDEKITKPTLKNLKDSQNFNQTHLQKVVVMYPSSAPKVTPKEVPHKIIVNERMYDLFLRIMAVVLLAIVFTIIFRTIF
jgi:hypothetical protein